MRYRFTDFPHLLANPVGRYELLIGQRHSLWPLLKQMAAAHRTLSLARSEVVTVIGSLGKSTATRAVSAALGLKIPQFPPANSWSGLAVRLLSARRNSEHVVLEVGISGKGTMKKYFQMIRPTIVVATSVASEHHRALGSLEDIRSEKADMVRLLPSSGYAVLNGDDPHVMWMATQTGAETIRYGFGKENDIRASSYRVRWPAGSSFELTAHGIRRTISTRLLGREMMYSLLAGVAVGLAVGRELDEMISRIGCLEPTPGRMEIVRLDNGAVIIKDDYKSTFETVFTALDTLASIPADRKIAVLGEVEDAPGSTGPIYRKIGRTAALCDAEIMMIGGKRNFQPLRAGALQAGMAMDDVLRPTRAWHEVYKRLNQCLTSGDVVLIKGRRTQRLDRLTLALQNRSVHCHVQQCQSSMSSCSTCPMLERGWKGLRVTV